MKLVLRENNVFENIFKKGEDFMCIEKTKVEYKDGKVIYGRKIIIPTNGCWLCNIKYWIREGVDYVKRNVSRIKSKPYQHDERSHTLLGNLQRDNTGLWVRGKDTKRGLGSRRDG
jgi:hypothetical protein